MGLIVELTVCMLGAGSLLWLFRLGFLGATVEVVLCGGSPYWASKLESELAAELKVGPSSLSARHEEI